MVGIGLPPLPVVSEVAALVMFCATSLDDAVEDAVKVLLLFLVVKLAVRITGASTILGGFTGAVILPVVLAVYPLATLAGDAVGDQVEPLQVYLAAVLGTSLPGKRPSYNKVDPHQTVWTALLDDLVEDSFKSFCLYTHYRMGEATSAATVLPLAQRSGNLALGRVAAFMVSIGHPAAAYNACDAYGDILGDRIQMLLTATPRQDRGLV